jgi:hypothetical protein
MGGKSANYRPPPKDPEPEGSEGSGQTSENERDEEEEAQMSLGNDAALEVDTNASQQQGLADWMSQLPNMEAPPAGTVQEPEAPLFPEGHLFQAADISKCILHKEKRIHVSLLKWDKAMLMGQIRPLQTKVVEHYVHRLRATPPRRVVRVLVKAQPGVFCHAPTRR